MISIFDSSHADHTVIAQMITKSKQCILTVQSTNIFPNDIANIICAYINPGCDEDKLEELLSIQKKPELKIGSEITVSWSDKPRCFRKKLYRLRIHGFDSCVYESKHSLRGFRFTALLPGQINAPDSEMYTSIIPPGRRLGAQLYSALCAQRPFWDRVNNNMKKHLARF